VGAITTAAPNSSAARRISRSTRSPLAVSRLPSARPPPESPDCVPVPRDRHPLHLPSDNCHGAHRLLRQTHPLQPFARRCRTRSAPPTAKAVPHLERSERRQQLEKLKNEPNLPALTRSARHRRAAGHQSGHFHLPVSGIHRTARFSSVVLRNRCDHQSGNFTLRQFERNPRRPPLRLVSPMDVANRHRRFARINFALKTITCALFLVYSGVLWYKSARHREECLPRKTLLHATTWKLAD